MTEITFLGVGSAMPAQPADDHTALLVRHQNATVLLDCGPTVVRQLERCGVGVDELTHVFVSHQHGDHALGFPMLMLHRWILMPPQPLVVMAAPEVLATLTALARLAYPDLMTRAEDAIDLVAVQASRPLPLPGAPAIILSTAPGNHSVPTWGVRLDFDARRSLVYSADTGPARAIAALATGADLLVHDTFYVTAPAGSQNGHSTAGQVGQLAAEASVKALALVHRADTTGEAATFYRLEAARHFAGPIQIPMRGDRITL